MKLSEINQTQKDTSYVIPLLEVPGGVKDTETQSRSVGAGGGGRGGECLMRMELRFGKVRTFWRHGDNCTTT